MSITLAGSELGALEHFLHRRKLRDQGIELLASIRGQNNLTRVDLSASKSLTYRNLAELLAKALEKGWLPDGELLKMLDDSEISGRHHVCVFLLPPEEKDGLFQMIEQPIGRSSGPVRLNDFLEVPTRSTARILQQSTDEIVVKIVAIRSYWLSEYEKDDPDEQLIRRWKESERSAIIIKCNAREGVVQVRVPPREKGQLETGKAVFDFMTEVIASHYPMDQRPWFNRIDRFPIADSYNKIIEDRKNFILKHDTPENVQTRSQISTKGSTSTEADLRDDPSWNHSKGYARRILRGNWICPDAVVFMHLNYDTVRIDRTTTRDLARIFVPGLCSDRDMDHAIRQIRSYLQ